MAAADEELGGRLKEHFEAIKFAKEVVSILTSSDLQHETRRSADTVDKIVAKIFKAKENTHSTIRGECTHHLRTRHISCYCN